LPSLQWIGPGVGAGVTIACACRPRQFALLLRKSGQPVVRAHAAGSSVTREPWRSRRWIARRVTRGHGTPRVREHGLPPRRLSWARGAGGPVGNAPATRCFLLRLAPAAASMSAVRSQWLPFRVLPDLCLPALSWVSRTEGGPAREVARAAKRAHVHTDLRADDLRGALIDPGNAIQRRQCVGERGDHRLHLSAQNPDGFVQIVEVR
jgi:hypothetical protein